MSKHTYCACSNPRCECGGDCLELATEFLHPIADRDERVPPIPMCDHCSTLAYESGDYADTPFRDDEDELVIQSTESDFWFEWFGMFGPRVHKEY